jgi:hypothetical protein
MLVSAACGERDHGAAAPAMPSLGATTVVVPGPGLPPEVVPQEANNNLDLVRWKGRLWLAFRSGPSHFASPEVVLHVISSEDEVTWRFEGTFARQTDLREPRFLALGDKLFLYFAELGKDSLDFTPHGMFVTEYQAPGQWTAPETFYMPGFIPWRTRTVDGKAYMIAYVGGESIYDFEEGSEVVVHFLTTDDGRNWRAVAEGKPDVLHGGGSETDFAFLDDGALVAVVRNEHGDADGWGSKICRAEKGALGDWRCKPDPRKYDSPLVFRHGPDVWLIGRRNVTDSGHFDLMMRELPFIQQTMKYLFDYSAQPKRTALWKVDPVALTVEWVLDFPSRGDTCFPGLVPLSATEYLIYNYSSPVEGPDLEWINGQLGLTNIYRTVITFE